MEHYLQNREGIKEKSRGRYKNLSQEKKKQDKGVSKKKISRTCSVQKRSIKKINIFFVCLQYKKNEWKHTKI